MLDAALGGSDTIDNHLNDLNISAQYAYQQTYALTLAYFDISGNSNHALYAPGPWFGSANGSPDRRGYIIQLECVPFGKFSSFARPWLNVRFGLQYTGRDPGLSSGLALRAPPWPPRDVPTSRAGIESHKDALAFGDDVLPGSPEWPVVKRHMPRRKTRFPVRSCA